MTVQINCRMWIVYCYSEDKPPLRAQRGLTYYYCSEQELLPVAVLIAVELKEPPTENTAV